MRCAGYNNVDLPPPKPTALPLCVCRATAQNHLPSTPWRRPLQTAASARHISRCRNNNFALDGLLGQNFYGACAALWALATSPMARICHGFGMNVLCYDMYKNPKVEKFTGYVSLEELLQKADLVSLHCPLTEGTHHMINKDTIAMMRDSAILVNTSRGGLIDTDALIRSSARPQVRRRGPGCVQGVGVTVFQDFLRRCAQNAVVRVLLSFPNVVIPATRRSLPARHCRALRPSRWKMPVPLPAVKN